MTSYVLIEIDPPTGLTIKIMRTFENRDRANEDLELLEQTEPARSFSVIEVNHIN